MTKVRTIVESHPHTAGGERIFLDEAAGWTWPVVLQSVGIALEGLPEWVAALGPRVIVEIDLESRVVSFHRGPQ